MEPAEIKALASLLDELDYYALLETKRGCASSELKTSYYALSRRFHPDANRHQPDDVRAAAERVAKRLTEAYSVLRNPKRRQTYDARLAEGTDSLRIQLAEAEAAADKKNLEERMGATPNGRRFYTLAHGDIDRGDLASAARNLRMALTYEPGNGFFKQKLAEIKKSLAGA